MFRSTMKQIGQSTGKVSRKSSKKSGRALGRALMALVVAGCTIHTANGTANADDATWLAIGRADQVKVVYTRTDAAGGFCGCTFNGQNVCTPDPTCFKDRTEVFVKVVKPPIPFIKPGISSLPVQIGGPCYNSDGFDVQPLCENLSLVLGSCAKTVEYFFFPSNNGQPTQTWAIYKCAQNQTPKCLGITGHLLGSGRRIDQIADGSGNGGGVPEYPTWLYERVREEGCY